MNPRTAPYAGEPKRVVHHNDLNTPLTLSLEEKFNINRGASLQLLLTILGPTAQ